MRYPSFVSGSNTSQSPIADCQRLINWYCELTQAAGAKAQAVLYPSPGLEDFFEVTQGPVRALGYQDGRAFAVIGFKWYEFFADGSTTDRGDVALDDNPATISFNSHGSGEVFITTGNEGYLYVLATSVLTNVVSDITVGGFIDGYFVALDAVNSTFRISDLEDGSTWDPLQVAQRTQGSDKWIGMAIKNTEVWLFGSETSEIWVNVGAFPFPFAPIPQALLQQGSAAAFSVGVLGDMNMLMWLGANVQGQGVIYRSEGYQAVRVSTHAVEYAISTYGTISDSIGYTYQDQGHTFYVLNFPTADATWVYDLSTGLWSERLFWNTSTAAWEAHRGICHAFAFGLHLIGDRSTGTVYNQAIDIFTDAGGEAMRRLRRAPHLFNEGKMIFYHRFQLDMQVGVGLSTGNGSDPQILLRCSNDGGQTWGHGEWITFGALGQYFTRVVWRRLGASRDRVFEVTVSAAVPVRINDAWLEFTAGDS